MSVLPIYTLDPEGQRLRARGVLGSKGSVASEPARINAVVRR